MKKFFLIVFLFLPLVQIFSTNNEISEIDYDKYPDFVALKSLVSFLFDKTSATLEGAEKEVNDLLTNNSKYFNIDDNQQLILKDKYKNILLSENLLIYVGKEEIRINRRTRKEIYKLYKDTPSLITITVRNKRIIKEINDVTSFYLLTIILETLDLDEDDLEKLPNLVFWAIGNQKVFEKVTDPSGELIKKYKKMFVRFVSENPNSVLGYFEKSDNLSTNRLLFDSALTVDPLKLKMAMAYFNAFLDRIKNQNEIMRTFRVIDDLNDPSLFDWFIEKAPLKIKVLFFAFYLIHSYDEVVTERCTEYLKSLDKDKLDKMSDFWELYKKDYNDLILPEYTIDSFLK